jgi:hypothetical protein
MDTLFNDPFFMILSVALVAALIYNLWQMIMRSKAWKLIATELNLEATQISADKRKDDALIGVYHQHNLILIEGSAYVLRQGKRKSDMITNATTIIKVAVTPPAAFKLNLNRLAASAKARDEGSGDAEVDRCFSIESEPPELVQELVAQEVISQGLLKVKLGGAIYLQEKELIYDQTGRVIDALYLRTLFDLLVAMAGAIEASKLEVQEEEPEEEQESV